MKQLFVFPNTNSFQITVDCCTVRPVRRVLYLKVRFKRQAVELPCGELYRLLSSHNYQLYVMHFMQMLVPGAAVYRPLNCQTL